MSREYKFRLNYQIVDLQLRIKLLKSNSLEFRVESNFEYGHRFSE